MDIKAIRIIPFSGKEEDWNRWSKTFLATATAKGNREVIKPETPTTKADDAKNVQVYNDLVLSCQDDITFGIVDESVSTDFPDGDARLAWAKLQEKFEPKTGAAKVQLKKEFHQCKLTSVDEDPEVWITDLELKRRRLKVLGTEIVDEDLILHIINNLPKEYEMVIELCEEDLSKGILTLKDARERIRARFNRIKKAKDDTDEAIALMTTKGFKGACTVCGKVGHKGADCFSLEKNKDKKEKYFKRLKDKRRKGKKNNKSKDKKQDTSDNNEDDTEIVLMANGLTNFQRNTWIADSGASTHMCNDISALYDLKETNQVISIGDGRKMLVTKTGKLRGEIIDENGKSKIITLTNVSFIPDLVVNLFSLTLVMEKDYSIVGTKKGIKVNKGSSSVEFYTKFGSTNGYIFGTCIRPINQIALVSETKTNKTYAEAHSVLGHPGQDLLEGTSQRLNWTLNGDKEVSCEDCMIAKARRANLNKKAKNPVKQPGKRLMIDISSVRSRENNKAGRFWLLVVDEATSMKWSFFLSSKKQQVSVLQGFLKQLNEMGHKVKHIRCDNAGENVSLKNELEKQGSTIRFEYTARATPQQNGKAERAFATLYGRIRAMMKGAGLNEDEKMKLWMEAAATATKLDNILATKGEESPYKKFYGEEAPYQNHLRTFGELGIVTLSPGSTIKAKLADRGEKCMFLGYAKDHAPNVYRMLNMRTGKVIITRDIKWIGYPESKVTNKEIDEDDDPYEENVPAVMPPEEQQDVDPPVNPPVMRLTRELRALQSFNTPGRLEVEGQTNQFCFFVPESSGPAYKEPITFQGAWNHHDHTEHHFWREAI